MPGYKKDPIWKNGDFEDDIFLRLNMFLIWMLWIIAVFFQFVIMTNFNIAQITSTYERVRGLEKKISFELKAEMNYETNILISTLYNSKLVPYRSIIFANTKSSSGGNTEFLDDQFNTMKKVIGKNNMMFDDFNK